ncbi:MAG: outer membrane beta-barrel protein [Chitinophagales bacterium]
MKKLILIFVMMPFAGFSQWTQQQQDDYRKQMEQLQQQMNDEMQQLRDSLQQLKQTIDWSTFDSVNSELRDEMPEPPMPGMMEAPMPEPPMPPGETEKFPGGEVYTNNRDTTIVRFGKWHVTVQENDGGKDHVQVYKDEDCDGCGDNDHSWDNSMHTVETKFLLLDVGVNNYFGPNFNSRLPGYEWFEPNPGKSWVVNIHLVNQRLNLIDHHLWLSYGLYFELNSYKYNNENVLAPRIDSVAYQLSDVPLKKNKVSCEYMGIPLMLRYESNPHDLSNSFHISAGGFGEYLIGARTKIKTTTNDKTKVHDDFNLNPFRYGITARAGYGFVNVFANFGLSKFFKDDVQPTAYPFSAGLAFEF